MGLFAMVALVAGCDSTPPPDYVLEYTVGGVGGFVVTVDGEPVETAGGASTITITAPRDDLDDLPRELAVSAPDGTILAVHSMRPYCPADTTKESIQMRYDDMTQDLRWSCTTCYRGAFISSECQ